MLSIYTEYLSLFITTVLQTLFYLLQTFTLSIFYSLNALMSNSRLATYTVGVLATS